LIKLSFLKDSIIGNRIQGEKIIYEDVMIASTGVYSRPRSKNQGAFDSFDDMHFFQMTVSPMKKVKLDFIEQNLQSRELLIEGGNGGIQLKKRPFNLIFVVPEDIFPLYDKPVIYEYHKSELPSWTNDIEQYALCISTNFEFFQNLQDLENFF
jgi:hypothetical protein